jgi:Winged helix-turn helix
VIRLHNKKHGVMQIVELTGLSWPAVRIAIDLYETGGMAALKPKGVAVNPAAAPT